MSLTDTLSGLFRHVRQAKRELLRMRASAEAARQLQAIRSRPASPFDSPPSPGHMRGLDFYNPRELRIVMARMLADYKRNFGAYPNVASPQLLNEKILWFKLFGEFKVPEAGNKLLTARFLPEEAADLVRIPFIAWHSTTPVLPPDESIEPGHYYLKASHGCNMYCRVRFPLDDRDRAKLEAECRRWLAKPYGLDDGEWWYNVFPKEILLEKDVSDSDGSTSWNFFVIGGQVESISLIWKPPQVRRGASLKTRLDPDFRKPESVRSATLDTPDISAQARHRMKAAAEIIGRRFGFVRVDFLLGPDETVYLNEITFTPGNGLIRRAPSLEASLGHKWQL